MSKVKDHCVIGLSVVSANNIPRTWVGTEAEAIAHAQALLDKQHRTSGYARNKPKPTKLAVVKVVKIVEVAAPVQVPVTVRPMGINDAEGER